MDLYDILDIDRNSSLEEIKKAYRKLAMQYHPDRNPGNSEAEKKFKDINQAYEVLGNEDKRREYDQFGYVGGNGNNFSSGTGFDVDLGDIFNSFFGSGFNSSSSGFNQDIRGEDIEYSIKIDLKTSIFGGKQTISIDKKETCTGCDGRGGKGLKKCYKCSGKGKITKTSQSIFGIIQQTLICDECNGKGEKIDEICQECFGKKRIKIKKDIPIEIPAGIDNGMIIKMSGEGNHGIGSKQKGDLYIKFKVSLEEGSLSRNEFDLNYKLDIDVLEAILGVYKDINIPIIGKRKIDIKAGTSVGTIIKIESDGVRHIDSQKKGDLFIELNILIPKKLDKIQRELFEKIAMKKGLNVKSKGIFDNIF